MDEQMKPSMDPPVVMGDKDASDNKLMAAICYIWIIGLILLFLKKDSPFVQFHAKQGTVLFVASVVLGFVPLLGWILNIVVFVFAIIGLISALQGKKTELPLVSNLAKMINF